MWWVNFSSGWVRGKIFNNSFSVEKHVYSVKSLDGDSLHETCHYLSRCSTPSLMQKTYVLWQIMSAYKINNYQIKNWLIIMMWWQRKKIIILWMWTKLTLVLFMYFFIAQGTLWTPQSQMYLFKIFGWNKKGKRKCSCKQQLRGQAHQ